MPPTPKMSTPAGQGSISKAIDDGSGMDYDLDGSFPPFGPEAFDQIKELFDLNIYRGRCETWAFKDIKFLVYDDSDEVRQPREPKLAHPRLQSDGVSVNSLRRVKENNLRARNRALDEVLDRAVDFVQTCGLRMIWIDQECLPQTDEDDREIGLQAMDIVYNRAIVTAGLHSTVMTSLSQIGAIETLLEVFRPATRASLHGVFLTAVIPPVLDFLNSVTKEKWYQRAWIAQESISASGKLFLVFPLGFGPFT
ncbi:hypothetical protein K4K54_003667 [Colletotrichum sp. SAR 10_86]|nr:hypothetical protein K4K54_003667 [Colletotrichum sp. SAR 10_86]